MKIHFFHPLPSFKVIRGLRDQYDYKSPHLVEATLSEEKALCHAVVSRVTKYKEDVTCKRCLHLIKFRRQRT